MATRSIWCLVWLRLLGACADAPALDVGVTFAAIRPDTPGSSLPPPVFSASDQVERFDSSGGAFRVHYTRRGAHAVPSADGNADGTPDFVRQVADEYDAVGEFYADELGFERPLSDAQVRDGNGGDARFDVYLLDFPTSADGAFRREDCEAGAAYRCTGYMLHENDFNDRNYPSLARANRILASHEYFHAVQTAYNAQAGVVIGEGTAVWASEQYDPTLNDLENFVAGYLERTERSIAQEPTGPVDPFAYGSSLFFQFLGERFDRDVIRALWAALGMEGDAATPQSWVPALDAILRGDHRSSLADAFTEFTRWNLYTAARADPSQAYARGAGYPEPKSEAVNVPFEDPTLRVFPLSARFYLTRVGEAGTLEFVATSASDLSGLRVLLAREVRGQIDEVRTSEPEAQRVTLEVEAGDAVHAVILNTRTSGESLRPALCLGTSGCGSDDEEPSGEADAGTSPGDDEESSEGDSDSGCSALGPRYPQRSTALWVGLALAAFFIRRRQR